MYTSKIKLRVRYAETDQMGYVYYGNYAQYFEVARVEALRSLGRSYKELEKEGVMLPVRDYQVVFHKPAYYDEELTIETCIPTMPAVRFPFEYKVYNTENELLTEARTTLVFIARDTGKPCAAPAQIVQALDKYFGD